LPQAAVETAPLARSLQAHPHGQRRSVATMSTSSAVSTERTRRYRHEKNK
jgi:hypothetical protein